MTNKGCWWFVLWAVVLFGLSGIASAEMELSDFEEKVFEGNDGLPYRLLSPGSLDANKKVPLVVYLQGIGARGDDNQKQLSATKFLENINRAGFLPSISVTSWRRNVLRMPAGPATPCKICSAWWTTSSSGTASTQQGFT